MDRLEFNYRDKVTALYLLNSGQKTTISPKITLQYDVSRNMKWYLKAGRGFHSNDRQEPLPIR